MKNSNTKNLYYTKNILFIILGISIMGFSCWDKDDKIIGNQDLRLEFFNNSESNLYVDYGFLYPDTSVGTYNILNDPTVFKSDAKDTLILEAHCCWEKFFGYSTIPSDTLMIFVFDAEIVETEDWEIVRTDYMILKRYDLSYDDLVTMDWLITYP